ncbi:hypothetical protein [Agromyces ramosus]|uniref:Uncharacterized protein n=1 Tax=Agromyces ramosus TaxID=33879 RepID=A0ABU0RB45_9MICO|nr:hypothetical protein [Agromyces ramosus]MDQ0895300.1 hypothetical protein [Agromyces ramosus]
MERIHYAGDELVTGTEIAEALMEYAAVLAQQRTAASVDIPVRHPDGSIGTASLLLGPASQLVREPVESAGKEVTDESLVQRLRRLTAALAPRWPVARTDTTPPKAVDYDWTDEV